MCRNPSAMAGFNDLSPVITGAPFPVRDQSEAELEDLGVGVYGQAKLAAWEKLDLTAGLRFDFENKDADLGSSTMPAVGPASIRRLSDDFSAVSPQFGLAFHMTPDRMAYGTLTRGYKAGGFNPISPGGNEAFGKENSWSYEMGFKSEWLEGRLQANAALFYMHWDELQLNSPFLAVPGRFYVDNVGAAASKGAELELKYRPLAGWDLFGSIGYTEAKFLSGSVSDGANVGGNRLPYTPKFTGNAGMQLSWAIGEKATLYARAEVTVYGDFNYDASSREAQDTHSLANFRAGVRGKRWFAEGWVKNAFDTEYVPIALAYSAAFAPSGYLGESGAPVTFGLRAGLNF